MSRSRDVWPIAHRGASRDRRENTLAAFDEALRQGAQGLELDLQLAADGVAVVHHDATLSRVGGGLRRVHTLASSTLRRHIPTLDAVLDRYGGRTRLLLEIKTHGGARAAERHRRLARAVADGVTARGLESDAMILCFDHTVLDECRRHAPGVGRVLNISPPKRLTRVLERLLPDLSAVSADVRSLTPAFGAALARARMPLFVYTCNRVGQVDAALAAGAGAIMSDRPRWLVEQLERNS